MCVSDKSNITEFFLAINTAVQLDNFKHEWAQTSEGKHANFVMGCIYFASSPTTFDLQHGKVRSNICVNFQLDKTANTKKDD